VSYSTKTGVAKETKREYTFIDTHQTKQVKFSEYNSDNGELKELITVSIDDLAKNSYSLNYMEYIKEDEVKYDDGIEVKTLGEVCDIEYGTRIVRKNNTEGVYPVYGSGRETFTTTTYNRKGFNILIGRFALSSNCVRIINKKLFLNDSGLTIKPKTDILLHKYIAYFMEMHQQIIYECARGTAQKNLDIDKFKNIKIPIPPIHLQTEIVEQLDFIYEVCIKTNQDNIEQLKKLNEICIINQSRSNQNEIKTLGEVCEFRNGKQLSRNDFEDGNIPVIGGGQQPSGYHNEYNRHENTILCSSSGAYAGYISKYNTKIWASDCFSITTADPNKVNELYLYYYLKNIQDNIYKLQTGTAQPHIYSKNISNMRIPVPPLKRQTEIVQICETNDNLIKQLEQQIIQNKQLAKDIIDTAINNVNSPYINNMIDIDLSSENDDIDKLHSAQASDSPDNDERPDLDNINSAKAVEQSDLDIIKKIKKIKKKKVSKSSDQDNINSAKAAKQSDLDDMNSAKPAEQLDLDSINLAKATEQSDLDSIKKIKKIKKKKVINSANQ
jgi:restriction endonuclease S subunit